MNSFTVRYLRVAQRLMTALVALVVSLGLSSSFTGTANASAQPEIAAPSIDIFIAVDNSAELSQTQFLGAQQAALDFVTALPDSTQVGVISFGSFPQVTQLTTADREATARAISNLVQEDGESQLFSGIGLAAESFNPSSTASRSVVVITDGRDGSSAQSIESGNRAALTNRVTISVIDSASGKGTDVGRQSVLKQLSGSRTVAFASDKTAVTALADQIRVQGIRSAPGQLALEAPDSGPASSILSSNLVLMVGGLLVAGAIFLGAMQLLGPKDVKVNLTGIPLPSKKDKKAKRELKSPVAGIATKLTDLADKKLQGSEKGSRMQGWLERAAINLRSGEFLVLAGLVSLIVAGAVGLMWGKFLAPLGLLIGAFGTRFVVNFKANKRSRKFGDQLSDTLQLLSSSMRAGQGFMQALDAVSKESESPTSEEFRRVVVETRLGRDLVESMKALSERIRCVDMEWVIPAIEINRDIGGDLAEVLEQVGATIRDRADLRRQVKTLSAEGRLSAFVLIAMPFGLGAFINTSNPEYVGVLFAGFGLYLCGIASVLMLIGSIWLFNICKIEF